MSAERLMAGFASGCDSAAAGAGIGGRLRERVEDFLVEEIPLYEPSGEGEHIYLFVEKHHLSTMEMVGVIAKHFGVRRRDVGYAGLKDKRAITRQVVSVWAPGKTVEDFPMLRHDKIGVLWADRHGNKLRRGHLKGNRFSIRIRGVPFQAVVHAQKVLDRLGQEGLANRIGEQRFGYLGNNHLVGRAIVLGRWGEAVERLLGPSESHPDAQPEARRAFTEGRYEEAIGGYHYSLRTERGVLKAMANGATAEQAVRSIEGASLSFFVTAFQSAVFNAVLGERERAGTLATLAEGDLAFMHASRASFMVGEAEMADPGIADRLARLEISPTGPMWGRTMRRAGGDVGRLELEALHAVGVTEEDLTRYAERGGELEGERRPLRVPVIDPDVEGGVDEHGAFVRCAFELPRGCFATSVMREIMGPVEEDGDE
jgi:tRNA pseudouridine13 synthase